MKRRTEPFLFWSASYLLGLAGSVALVPLLLVYLFIGTCGEGKTGFVLAFRAGGVAVAAAWCEAASSTDGS